MDTVISLQNLLLVYERRNTLKKFLPVFSRFKSDFMVENGPSRAYKSKAPILQRTSQKLCKRNSEFQEYSVHIISYSML